MDNLYNFSLPDDFEQLAAIYQPPRIHSVYVIDGELIGKLWWEYAYLDNGIIAFASMIACDMIIFKSGVG